MATLRTPGSRARGRPPPMSPSSPLGARGLLWDNDDLGDDDHAIPHANSPLNRHEEFEGNPKQEDRTNDNNQNEGESLEEDFNWYRDEKEQCGEDEEDAHHSGTPAPPPRSNPITNDSNAERRSSGKYQPEPEKTDIYDEQWDRPRFQRNPATFKPRKQYSQINEIHDALRPVNFAITPEKYAGLSTDDPQSYLASFELASQSNFWTNQIKVLRFPCFLTHRALSWFISADNERKRKRLPNWTWEELSEAFLLNSTATVSSTDQEFDLINRKQKPNESCLDYYYSILNHCDRVNPKMKDQDRIKHVLRGMRQKSKQLIKMHMPMSLDHLKTLVETADQNQESSTSYGDLDESLFSVTEKFKQNDHKQPTLFYRNDQLQERMSFQTKNENPEFQYRQNKALSYKSGPPRRNEFSFRTPQQQRFHNLNNRLPDERDHYRNKNERPNKNEYSSQPNRNITSRTARLCYGCRSDQHFIKDCPYLDIPNQRQNTNRWKNTINIGLETPIYLSDNPSNLLFACGRVGDQKVRALIDTGAAKTIINSRLIRHCMGTPIPVSNRLAGVTGEPVLSSGIVKFRLTLGEKDNCKIIANAYAVPKLNFDLLLGGDTLAELAATIDYQNSAMVVGQRTKITLYSDYLPSYSNEITNTVKELGKIDVSDNKTQYKVKYYGTLQILRPDENLNILARITTNDEHKLKEMPNHLLLDHSKHNQIRRQYIPPQYVKKDEQGVVNVWLQNPSKVPKLIKPGSTLGYVSELPSEFINIVQTVENNSPDTPTELSLTEELKKGINNALDEKEKQSILEVLEEFASSFYQTDQPLRATKTIAYPFNFLPGSRPVQSRMYNYSPGEKKFIEEHIDELLRFGIIQHSRSPYASPVVLVRNGHKSSQKPRFCIDYRKLNTILFSDAYPLPSIQNILDGLQGMKFFTAIDLAKGFHQISLRPEDIPATAFICHAGLFEYTRLPFGIKLAPGLFQRIISQCLNSVIGIIAYVYLDDIIIFSSDIETHKKNIRTVLELLNEEGFTISPSKCKFAMTKIKILGHYVSAEGISVDPEKTSCIRELTPPRDLKDVQTFLGLCNYYRRFVPEFSKRTQALTKLLKKEQEYIWNEEQQKAFEYLKEALCSAPILRHFDENLETVIHTDASGLALGACLSQKEDGIERVVAYASRRLTKSEKNYSTIQREFLALMFALEKFRHYIHGLSTFRVVTDHNPLLGLKHATNLNISKLHRWCARLSEYSFTLEHRVGRLHSNADALSRLWDDKDQQEKETESPHFNIYEEECPLEFPILTIKLEDLKQAQLNDSYCQKKIQEIESNNQSRIKAFQIQDGILYNTSIDRERIVIPQSMSKTILESLHDDKTSGHRGYTSTYAKIVQNYHWKNMNKDIEDYVRSCQVCQANKRPIRPAQGTLKPIPLTAIPHNFIAIDVTGPLPVTPTKSKYLIVVICLFSKYVTLQAIPNQTAPVVCKFLIEEIFTKFGPPNKMLSDRGTNFLSNNVKSLLDNYGVKAVHTSGYNPQANGCVERQMATIKDILRSYIDDTNQETWDKYIPYVAWVINTSLHSTTGKTPFELVYARKPIQPIDRALGIKEPILTNYLNKAQQMREKLLGIIQKAQNRYKSRYDKGRENIDYPDGSFVLIKDPSTKLGLNPKLVKRWKGPYLVNKRMSELNYEVLFGINGPTRVINIRRMKPYFCPYEPEEELEIPPLQSSEEWLYNLHRNFQIIEAHNDWESVLKHWKNDSTDYNGPISENDINTLHGFVPIVFRKQKINSIEKILKCYQEFLAACQLQFIIVYGKLGEELRQIGTTGSYNQMHGEILHITRPVGITFITVQISQSEKPEHELSLLVLEPIDFKDEAYVKTSSSLIGLTNGIEGAQNPCGIVYDTDEKHIAPIIIALECIKTLESTTSALPMYQTIKTLKTLMPVNHADTIRLATQIILHYFGYELKTHHNYCWKKVQFDLNPTYIENSESSQEDSCSTDTRSDDSSDTIVRTEFTKERTPNYEELLEILEELPISPHNSTPEIIQPPDTMGDTEESIYLGSPEDEEDTTEYPQDSENDKEAETQSKCQDKNVENQPTTGVTGEAITTPNLEDTEDDPNSVAPSPTLRTRFGRPIRPPRYLEDYEH